MCKMLHRAGFEPDLEMRVQIALRLGRRVSDSCLFCVHVLLVDAEFATFKTPLATPVSGLQGANASNGYALPCARPNTFKASVQYTGQTFCAQSCSQRNSTATILRPFVP